MEQQSAKARGRPVRTVAVDWLSFPVPGPGFGPRLEAWRKAAGCTHQQISDALRAPGRQAVRRWERSEREPGGEYSARIEALRQGGPDAVRAIMRDRLLEQAKKIL